MHLSIKEISLVAIFPAMMAATAGISMPMGSLPAITLQTFFVFMAGLLLGPKLGTISILIYVIMGVIGLPVFSNYRGGFEVLVSGSGGFIIKFVLSAGFIGIMKNIKIINNHITLIFVVLIFGNMLIYLCGAAYISYIVNVSLFSVLATFTPYIIGDILKIIVVIYVYLRIGKHYTYERL